MQLYKVRFSVFVAKGVNFRKHLDYCQQGRAADSRVNGSTCVSIADCFLLAPTKHAADISHLVQSPSSPTDFSDSRSVAACSLFPSELAAKESRLRT